MVACRKVNIKYTSSGTELTAFIPDLCQVQAVLRIVMATGTGRHTVYPDPFWPQHLRLEFSGTQFTVHALDCTDQRGHFVPLAGNTGKTPASSQARLAFVVVLSVTLVYALLAEGVRLQVDATRFALAFRTRARLSGSLPGDQRHSGWRGTSLSVFAISVVPATAGRTRSPCSGIQARIRPHFLFNSMNSIAGLIPLDPHQAEEAVIDLAELFRTALKDSHDLVPLYQELEVCQRYLRIENYDWATA